MRRFSFCFQKKTTKNIRHTNIRMATDVAVPSLMHEPTGLIHSRSHTCGWPNGRRPSLQSIITCLHACMRSNDHHSLMKPLVRLASRPTVTVRTIIVNYISTITVHTITILHTGSQGVLTLVSAARGSRRL